MAGLTWSGRTTARALVTLALAAVSACGGQALSVPDDDAWVRASDAVTQVSVELPGVAEVQSQQLPLPTGEQVAARLWLVDVAGAGSASLMVVDTQGRPLDLPGALAGAAANVNGQVQQQAPASQGALNAIDGTIAFSHEGTEGTIHLRIVDTGGSMVMLQSAGRSTDTAALTRLHQRLLDSLVVPQ